MSDDRRTVFRVLTAAQWRDAREEGHIAMSPLDERDGFVHLSTAETTLETADRYFQPSMEPVLVEMDAAAFGEDLRWELVASRNNEVFPHLYAPGIPLSAVSAVIELVVTDSGFKLGERRSHQ